MTADSTHNFISDLYLPFVKARHCTMIRRRLFKSEWRVIPLFLENRTRLKAIHIYL